MIRQTVKKYITSTEFYHSWNRNIVTYSPESWEALTVMQAFFKTMFASICIRIDRQMQHIIFPGYNETISIM